MLLFKNTGGQRFGRIGVMDRDGSLNNDRPFVDPFRDKVHCAAGDLTAMIDCLFLDVEPGKGRQQRGMNIHHAVLKSFDEDRRDDPHVTGEQHEFDFVFLQHLQHRPVIGFPAVRSPRERLGIQKDIGYPMLAGSFEAGPR